MDKKQRNIKKSIKEVIASKKYIKFIICFVCIILSYMIILSAVMPKKYDVSPGMKSEFDINAPRDMVNTVLTEQHAEEMRAQVKPVVVKTDISAKQINVVADIFVAIRNVRKDMSDEVAKHKYTIPGFHKGSIKEGEVPQGIPIFSNEKKFIEENLNRGTKMLLKNNIELPKELIEDIYIYASDEQMDLLEKNIRDILVKVFENDIFDYDLNEVLDFAENELSKVKISGKLKQFGDVIFNYAIKPNCSIDEEHTRMLREQAYSNAMQNSKVVVNADERIVSVGDIITWDKYSMLEDLNMIKDGKTNYSFSLAVLMITLILFFIFIFYFTTVKDKLLASDEVLLVCSVIVLVLIIARVIPSGYIYFIPVTTAAMLLTVLTNEKIAFVSNIVLSLSIAFMYNWDATFLVMSLCVGSIIIYPVKRYNKRSGLSLCGIFAGILNVFVIFAFALFNRWGWNDIGIKVSMGFLNGIVSAVISIGVLPIIEIAFDVITPIKLLELSNPNQDVLKRLLLEAPGTYHHSIMVGNLAENAAEAIGGDPLMARVGAYYHDIGKLKRPDFFIENQVGSNPHDKLNPSLSKMIITSHVKDGLRLAKGYKLPKFIQKFIIQHHGTTLVTYFYHKAMESNKNNDIRKRDYRYNGERPDTKESAVVMLADSVEAAIRSINENKTEGKIKGIILKIIKSKYVDGQLDKCDITLRDLNKISEAFVKVFGGYYHERNKYPKLSDFEEGKKLKNGKVNGR